MLVRRGLSSGKSRRQSKSEEWREYFDTSMKLRAIVLILSYLGLIRIGLWQNTPEILGETVVLSLLLMGMCVIILPLTYQKIWRNNRLLILLLGSVMLNAMLNKWLYTYNFPIDFIETTGAAFLVPSAIGSMACTVLISANVGLLVAFLVAVSGSVFVESSPAIFFSSLLTGFSAVYFCRNIRRRSDLLIAGMGVGLVGMGIVFILFIGGLVETKYDSLLVQVILAVVLGIMNGFVFSAILPVLEWMFDRITYISWVELTDVNHPLLKQMTIDAPGTYHHSLMVANLAEAAAESIGANATQCRVSAYFHDVGKLHKPEYFVENSSPEHNAHDNLSPTMSALIIIAHVKDGVDVALKHGLRQPIIDAIQQHHGTSLVYYFYKKALQQKDDVKEGGKIMKMREEDIPDVDERSFRYPGPIPQFKEAALVSLADAIESSSRTLKNPTAQKIESLVHDIINDRVMDGQLRDSGLTFNELAKVADRFTFTLKNMLHSRIDYPKDKEKPKKDGENNEVQSEGTEPSKKISNMPGITKQAS